MGNPLQRTFGQRLRFFRRQYNLTQAELAERIGISVDYLSKIERGLASPSFSVIESLSQSFSIDPSRLFLLADKPGEDRGKACEHQRHAQVLVDLSTFLASHFELLTDAFRASHIRPIFDLEHVKVPVSQALPLVLAYNEVMARMVRHKAQPNGASAVKVTLSANGDAMVRLVVTDGGSGLPPGLDTANPESPGLKLIQALVKDQLKGHVTLEAADPASVRIEFPRDEAG